MLPEERSASRALIKRKKHIISPAQRQVQAGAPKANSYVQPSVFDMLAGASPASAMDGWAE
jgi:hypothetical protein